MRLAIVVLAVLTTACGPTIPDELAMRQVQIDVRYGASPSPTGTPAPAYQPPPEFSFPTPEFVPRPPAPVPSPPPPSCPSLPQLATPKDPATALIAGPPPKNAYGMRSSGTYSLGSTNGTLPTSIQLLQPNDPQPGTDQVDGSFSDYSLVETVDPSTYWGFDLRMAPNNPATPGILITGMHWRDKVRGSFDFNADASGAEQPVQFLPTPVSVGSTWTSTGTDPVDETSIELQGSIPSRTTVNACGTALDSFDVHISGTIVSPTMQLTWTADYDIGTQFDALPLAEHVTLSGPDSNQGTGGMYSYDFTATINSMPFAPSS